MQLMHFYCTTEIEEIHCSCGFRGFGQGHRHHGAANRACLRRRFLFCRNGRDEIGVRAKMESSWGEEEPRSEQESDFAEKSLSANTADDDEVTGTKASHSKSCACLIICLDFYKRNGIKNG